MTEKQEEICECGHDLKYHYNLGEEDCSYEDCQCKKFTPKLLDFSKEALEDVRKTQEGTQNQENLGSSSKKGCGKHFRYNKMMATCGESYTGGMKQILLLCPTCQEKEK